MPHKNTLMKADCFSNLGIQALFALVLLLSFLLIPNAVQAQEETGLCPENFNEGVVTTGYVDCFRTTGASSDREVAEQRRLVREAECIAEPRSELIFSAVLADRNGNFFPSLICRINRIVPVGTVLCPDDSLEIFRAFDTLACEFFGSASNDQAGADAALAESTAACNAAPGGTVLVSSVKIGTSQDDDEPFFFTDLSCGFDIPATDVFQCPVGFNETSRSEDSLSCTRQDVGLVSESAAMSVNQQVGALCADTTAGLGEVTFSLFEFDTSGTDTFSSFVDCEIALPRFGEFEDAEIVRACDATCTEDIEQTRACLNGGVIGGPGCTAESSQIISQECNTGTDKDGLCPIMGIPAANIVPLLLLDDEPD